MNPLLQRLMAEAALLTRDGRLQEATDAIQRTLRSGAAHMPFAHAPADTATAPEPAKSPTKTDDDDIVIDGCIRVIDDAPEEATATPVPPAARTASPEQWTDGSFSHQGRALAYKLYVPPQSADAVGTPGTRRPLVLMLHGCTQGPDDFAAGTRMNELARREGFIVIYPAQTQHANSQKCWNWFKPQHQRRGRGEPALLAALTQSIVASHDVDPSRVYVAGLSAGGAMADILGRRYPDVFAAVGVHSGLPTGAASDVMSALSAMRSGPQAASALATQPLGEDRMPALIVFHGDADATVHPSNAAAVAKAALTGDAPAARTVTGSSAQGQRFTRTDYPDAGGRSAVEVWLLHGAGHAWSGGSASGSYTEPRGADASAEMLRFFLDHPMARP